MAIGHRPAVEDPLVGTLLPTRSSVGATTKRQARLFASARVGSLLVWARAADDAVGEECVDLVAAEAELTQNLFSVLALGRCGAPHGGQLIVELHGSGREPETRVHRVRHGVAVVDDCRVGENLRWRREEREDATFRP